MSTLLSPLPEELARALVGRLRDPEVRVALPGIGALHGRHYPGFEGRDPLTGEIVPVAAKTVPVFAAGDSANATLPALGEIAAAIAQALARGATVKIPRLGTFAIRIKEGRVGRNPATGEEIRIPAARLTVFRASPWLVRALNGSDPDATLPAAEFNALLDAAAREPFDVTAFEALVALAPAGLRQSRRRHPDEAPVAHPLLEAAFHEGVYLGELRTPADRQFALEALWDGAPDNEWIAVASDDDFPGCEPGARIWLLGAGDLGKADPLLRWIVDAGHLDDAPCLPLSSWVALRTLDAALQVTANGRALSTSQMSALAAIAARRSWPQAAFTDDPTSPEPFPSLRPMLPD
jgi:DNA-binding protein HU-beta